MVLKQPVLESPCLCPDLGPYPAAAFTHTCASAHPCSPQVLDRLWSLLPLALAPLPVNALVYTLDGVLVGASDFKYMMTAMVGASAVAAGSLVVVQEEGWGIQVCGGGVPWGGGQGGGVANRGAAAVAHGRRSGHSHAPSLPGLTPQRCSHSAMHPQGVWVSLGLLMAARLATLLYRFQSEAGPLPPSAALPAGALGAAASSLQENDTTFSALGEEAAAASAAPAAPALQQPVVAPAVINQVVPRPAPASRVRQRTASRRRGAAAQPPTQPAAQPTAAVLVPLASYDLPAAALSLEECRPGMHWELLPSTSLPGAATAASVRAGAEAAPVPTCVRDGSVVEAALAEAEAQLHQHSLGMIPAGHEEAALMDSDTGHAQPPHQQPPQQ